MFFVLFLLLLGIAYAAKGNIDIMKKDLIDDCEEITEFGDCIIQEEIEPVTTQFTTTSGRIGLSIATSLGIQDSANVIIFLVSMGTLVIMGIVVFVVFASILSALGGGGGS